VKLVEREHCFLIDNFFDPNIITGFTKSSLEGNLPGDVYKAISFLNQDFSVRRMSQPHSNEVNHTEALEVSDADGLFTNKSQEVLVVKSADCLPIFFSSQELGVVGVVHMGWRSAAKGILDNINYDLKSFKVALGVGLRKCCYRVGNEFLDYPIFSKYFKQENGQFYFDPVRFAKEELSRRGLKLENFYDLGICSFCSKIPIFSYRHGDTNKRTLSFILRKQ